VLLSGILGPAAMSQERGLEDRREGARDHDGQRQRRRERDEEGRNTLADPAGHDQLVDHDDDRAVGRFAVVVFIVPSGSRWPCRRPATGDPPVLAQRGR
jgi:hypothetical protein